MKIVHTGDWHIGKILNEYSLIEDQKYYLDRFLERLEKEKPDALIIAGDIYDRSVPPIEAVELLDNVLSKIILEFKIPVLAIAGNHDSAERLSFGSKLLKNKGLYIEGIFKKEIEKVTLQDEYGNVNFYLLPFVDPAKVRVSFNNNEVKSYDDSMKFLVSEIEKTMNKDERNILISHGYVTFNFEDKETKGKLEISESERPLTVGGTELIDANSLKVFDYVALGHLHKAQLVGSDKIRYSGSLLKYSVSEANQRKSITVIELNGDKEVKVELKEIKPLRNLRVVKGTLEELINKKGQENKDLGDYIFAELTDTGEVMDAMTKLKAVFPKMLGLKMTNQTAEGIESKTSASGNLKEKTMMDLFNDFYVDLKGKEMEQDRLDIITEVLDEIERGNN